MPNMECSYNGPRDTFNHCMSLIEKFKPMCTCLFYAKLTQWILLSEWHTGQQYMHLSMHRTRLMQQRACFRKHRPR